MFIPDPGSRIQGSKMHWKPDPPQCLSLYKLGQNVYSLQDHVEVHMQHIQQARDMRKLKKLNILLLGSNISRESFYQIPFFVLTDQKSCILCFIAIGSRTVLCSIVYDRKPSQYIQWLPVHFLHIFWRVGQPCLGHFFAYVANFVSFFRDLSGSNPESLLWKAGAELSNHS